MIYTHQITHQSKKCRFFALFTIDVLKGRGAAMLMAPDEGVRPLFFNARIDGQSPQRFRAQIRFDHGMRWLDGFPMAHPEDDLVLIEALPTPMLELVFLGQSEEAPGAYEYTQEIHLRTVPK